MLLASMEHLPLIAWLLALWHFFAGDPHTVASQPQTHHVSVGGHGDVATWAVAAGTFLLAFFALLALRGLGDSRRTRHSAVMTDLSRRWDEETLRRSRQEMAIRSSREIARISRRWWFSRATAGEETLFYLLEALPNYLETLGVIEYEIDAVSLELIDRLWGSAITSTWLAWELPIALIRRRNHEPRIYENFELLVERVQAHQAGRLPPLRPGETTAWWIPTFWALPARRKWAAASLRAWVRRNTK